MWVAVETLPDARLDHKAVGRRMPSYVRKVFLGPVFVRVSWHETAAKYLLRVFSIGRGPWYAVSHIIAAVGMLCKVHDAEFCCLFEG